MAAVQKLAETAPEQFAEKLSGNWDKLSEPAQQAFIGSLGRDVSEEAIKSWQDFRFTVGWRATC